MQKYCTNCGTKRCIGDNFCGNCGCAVSPNDDLSILLEKLCERDYLEDLIFGEEISRELVEAILEDRIAIYQDSNANRKYEEPDWLSNVIPCDGVGKIVAKGAPEEMIDDYMEKRLLSGYIEKFDYIDLIVNDEDRDLDCWLFEYIPDGWFVDGEGNYYYDEGFDKDFWDRIDYEDRREKDDESTYNAMQDIYSEDRKQSKLRELEEEYGDDAEDIYDMMEDGIDEETAAELSN